MKMKVFLWVFVLLLIVNTMTQLLVYRQLLVANTHLSEASESVKGLLKDVSSEVKMELIHGIATKVVEWIRKVL